jgi:adenylosuccinate synthase
VGYRLGGETLTEFPSDLRLLARCEPIYETLGGWSGATRGLRRFADLPPAARRYIARLEEITGVQVAIVSTGSDRDDTIMRDDDRAAEWLRASLTRSR